MFCPKYQKVYLEFTLSKNSRKIKHEKSLLQISPHSQAQGLTTDTFVLFFINVSMTGVRCLINVLKKLIVQEVQKNYLLRIMK